jgi:hypothetical protein
MRLLKSPVFWLTILLIALILALHVDLAWVRGPVEWRWPRHDSTIAKTRVWLPLLLLVVVLGGMKGLEKPLNRRPSLSPFFLFIASLLIQISFVYLESAPVWVTLFHRTVSSTSGGFFSVASNTQDIPSLLQQFPSAMAQFNAVHPRTHPPGLLLFFWSMSGWLSSWPTFSESFSTLLRPTICQDAYLTTLPNTVLASASVQMSVPVWGALTVFPFYGLARRLSNDMTARWATLLLVLSPSMVLWAAQWNQLYAFLTAVCLYLAHLGLTRRLWWLFLVAGLLVSIATFLSLANLALACLIPLYSLIFILFTSQSWRTGLYGYWQQGIAYGVGLASVWLIYYLTYGVGFWDITRAGMAVHTELDRTYTTWLGYNLYDFFLFLSFPILILALQSLRLAVNFSGTSAIASQYNQLNLRETAVSPALAAIFTFWITLLALNLSGIVRGEVARLWMFLVPLAVLAALPAILTWGSRIMWAMIIFQAAFLLVLGYNLWLIRPGLPHIANQTAVPSLTAFTHPVTAELDPDRAISFLGYKLQPEPLRRNDTLQIILYWRASQEDHTRYPYTVFVHMLDADGNLVAQYDGIPQGGQYPNSCWQQDQVVVDVATLPLPPDLPPGTYTLQAGMYRPDWLQAGNPAHRVPVFQHGQMSDAIQLGEVEVVK